LIDEKKSKKPRGRPRKTDKLSKIKSVKVSKSLEIALKVYCLRHETNESQAIRLAIERLVADEEKEK
jgi:hypothetical protein